MSFTSQIFSTSTEYMTDFFAGLTGSIFSNFLSVGFIVLLIGIVFGILYNLFNNKGL